MQISVDDELGSRPPEDTVALVTGSTDGLGRALAEQLAAMGMTVHLHGRDDERLATAMHEIAAATGNQRLHTHLADLSSLAQVRRLADEIAALDALHLLVNNAGIGSGYPDSRERQESADGIELRFAVNYLAGFVLTERLLPQLERSAPARVVMVAAGAPAQIDFADPMLERSPYDGLRAYLQSKLAMVAYTFELADRLGPAAGVTVNALHPSTFMPTKIVLEEMGKSIDTLEEGAAATMRLAVDPALDGVSGGFFNRQEESRAGEQAYDPEAQARLRELSERLAQGVLSD